MEERVMKCQRCHRDISDDESFTHLGETLCDDCYMDVMSPPKPCDPWAVYSATRTRESTGFKGGEGLTPLQKEIYEFIKNKGKVTAEEVMINFKLTQRELETQFATLRHCELARGQKEGDKVYFVPF
jgi:late competence protein required for DNA uptake (superfamily II DNA/RNA helicase)